MITEGKWMVYRLGIQVTFDGHMNYRLELDRKQGK